MNNWEKYNSEIIEAIICIASQYSGRPILNLYCAINWLTQEADISTNTEDLRTAYEDGIEQGKRIERERLERTQTHECVKEHNEAEEKSIKLLKERIVELEEQVEYINAPKQKMKFIRPFQEEKNSMLNPMQIVEIKSPASNGISEVIDALGNIWYFPFNYICEKLGIEVIE